MAYYERGYYQDSDQPRGFGGGRWSMVTWLMIINAAVFMLDSVLLGSRRGTLLSPSLWGHFSIDRALDHWQVWRFFSYQFIHAGLLHIFFNMLALYFFGRQIENWWGSKRFLAFYLLCGVCGAFIYTALWFIPGLLGSPAEMPLVGASGSVFGILVASAVLFPRQQVMLLFPPIPMTMRTMAMIFLGIAVLSVVVGAGNAGGEAAHLGGALLGWFLVKHPNLLNFADGAPGTSGTLGNSRGGILQRWSERRRERQAQRRAATETARQAEMDRILDKVKEKGLHSLTDREKRLLQSETDRMRKTG